MIESMELAPGESLEIFANQGQREATVIAAIGDERLIEYEMPKGSTALRIINVNDPDGHYKTVSYRAVPRVWLEATVAAGIGWQGRQQGINWLDAWGDIRRNGPVEKSPEEMLAALNRGGKHA